MTITGCPQPHLLVFATQGSGHGDERRVVELLKGFGPALFNFDRGRKVSSLLRLLSMLRETRPRLVVMEGTGYAGGFAVMVGRSLLGIPYVVSSGDAIAPFLSLKMPWLKPLFGIYERCLYRLAAGFIGWTPYLAGRALTLGARRAMTAPGWASFSKCDGEMAAARVNVRRQWGIPADALVFGIAGTLDWNRRVKYCYGSELVRAAAKAHRADLRILIAGDGSGRRRLEELAGAQLGKSIILTGRVPPEQVIDYLAAMDVGSLPQSVDGVGSFRYTIKLGEYLAASLPVATGQIPLAYDLDEGWLWRLPGEAPWDGRYIEALGRLMADVSREQILAKRAAVPHNCKTFDKSVQMERVAAFIHDLLDRGT